MSYNKAMRIHLPLLPILVFLTQACTTPPGTRVVESAEGQTKPQWADPTQPTVTNAGRKFFLGSIVARPDASKSVALRAAEEKALDAPFRALEEEFLKAQPPQEKIISALRERRMAMSGLEITHRYWELVDVVDNHGTTRRELRAYALAEISVTDYEEARRKLIEKTK